MVLEFRYKTELLPAIFIACLIGPLYAPLPEGLALTIQFKILFGLFLAITATYFLWKFQQPEKTKYGSLGIIIAIKSEDEKTRQRMSSDFVSTCRALLIDSKAHQPFHVIQLNDHHSGQITDNKSADLMRQRCKAQFLIYGTTAQRKERGKNFYVLRLQGLVGHAPITLNDQSLFAHEMNAVLPLKEKILEEDELSGFEVTSIKFSDAVKYVIATASLLSHDAQLAVSLLEELYNNKKRLNDANVKAVHKLNELTKKRLAAAYHFMSVLHFCRWETTRNPEELKSAITWIEKSDITNSNKHYNFDTLLIKAIGHFVFTRNIVAAMHCINKCKSQSITSPAWKYSAAFLEAYTNNLNKAKNYYDAALSTEINHDIPFQVEDFIAWILELEPDKNQLHFSLGYINEKFKSDSVSALKHYQQFLTGTATNADKCTQHANQFIANTVAIPP